MSLRPGEVFAGYTIERELGSGGMGAVYLARHPRLPRSDALKLLRTELCADPGFVGRFEREADTVAQLDHPNIVAVYDRGSADGQLWISMRFIDGTNAEKALAEWPRGMPPDRAVRIVGRVASALDYAHRRDLLHRDVKPANILLARGGDDEEESERVFLSDFGVAKVIGAAADRIASLTSAGDVVATLDYASPEQLQGQALDHRSDIYALGCVLYKLLTGSVPFPGESIATRIYGHLNSAARPPSTLAQGLPTGFDDVVATAMAKEPGDRYPTCRALAQAATAALTDSTDSSAVTQRAATDLATTVTERPSGERPTQGPSIRTFVPAADTPDPAAIPTPQVNHQPTPQTKPAAAAAPVGPAASVGSGVPAESRTPARPGSERGMTGGGNGTTRPRSGSQVVPDAGPSSPRGGAPRPTTVGRAGEVARNAARRRILLAGGLAVVVLGGIGTWAAFSSSGIAGTAGPVASSSLATSPITATTASTTGSPSESPSAASSSPGPVPGLPHSASLPESVLISSRVVDGATNLYQVNAADDSVGAQLTTSGIGPAYPILSPDRGSMIFVQTGPSGSSLRVAAVDGTGERDLLAKMPDDCASFYRPAWNPADQTEIALPCVTSAGDTVVQLLSVDRGTASGTLQTGFPIVDDLAYSPDGTHLVYWGVQVASDASSLYLLSTAPNATPTRLVAPPTGASDADATFSPDGSRIVFRRLLQPASGSASAQIMVVNVDGSGIESLTDGQSVDQDPIWSPDGSMIAFKSNRPNAAGTTDNQIWVIAADGTGLRELGVGSPGHADGAPAWGHR